MKSRVLTSVAIVAVALLLVVFSEFVAYPMALAVLAVIASYEIMRVIGAQKMRLLSFPAYLIAAAFPVMAYYVTEKSAVTFILILAATLYVYLMWLAGVSIFSKGKIPFTKIAEAFTVTAYVTVSFTSMSLLRYINPTVGVLRSARLWVSISLFPRSARRRRLRELLAESYSRLCSAWFTAW